MNKENMQKAIDYLEANYDDISTRFSMKNFRENTSCDLSPVCRSTGCLVGHLTAIDADNVDVHFRYNDGSIRYEDWSEWFFFDDVDDNTDYIDDARYFMFNGTWSEFPETNTLRQGINRMKYMLKHQQPPKNWKYGDTYE